MTTAYENGQVPEITLRHRLMIARLETGMSQSDLAHAIGVSRTSISNAESGTVTPRRIVVNAWALATGVPVSWLLKGETPAGPEGPDEGPECARRDSNPKPSDP